MDSRTAALWAIAAALATQALIEVGWTVAQALGVA